MDEKLRWVAQAGDTNGLYRCIQEDPDVLDRLDEAEFVDTPLPNLIEAIPASLQKHRL